MSITPDHLFRMFQDSRTIGHEYPAMPDNPSVQQRPCLGGLHDRGNGEYPEIEIFLARLRELGLSQIVAVLSWSIIPMAPLLSHLGVVIFGREAEEQPVWWQVMSSPTLLAWLSNRLYEE